MYYSNDNPCPMVKDTIRAAVLRHYLQDCIHQIDWKALESKETDLAIQTLQEILTAMQNNQTSDRETLDEINEIFVRRLGQHTIKGLRQAANPSASKTE